MTSEEKIGSVDLDGQIDFCRRKLDLLKDSLILRVKQIKQEEEQNAHSKSIPNNFQGMLQYFEWWHQKYNQKDPEEAKKMATIWVQCWEKIVGFTYPDMYDMVIKHNKTVAEGTSTDKEINERWWNSLNLKSSLLPNGISKSRLADTTVKHFHHFIKKQQSTNADNATLFSNKEGKQINENKFDDVNAELYSYMDDRISSIASTAEISKDDKNSLLKNVMDTLIDVDLNGLNIVALTSCDTYYHVEKSRQTQIAQIFKAFLKEKELSWPKLMNRENLIPLLIDYSINSKYAEMIPTDEMFDAYDTALLGLFATKKAQTPIPEDIPSSTCDQEIEMKSNNQMEKQNVAQESLQDAISNEASNDVSNNDHNLSEISLPHEPLYDPNDRVKNESSEDDKSDSTRHTSNSEESDRSYRSKSITCSEESIGIEPCAIMVDGRNFDFKNGECPSIHDMANHPLQQLEKSSNSKLLHVYCHVGFLGEGYLAASPLSYGAYTDNGKSLFIPILPDGCSTTLLQKLKYATHSSKSGRKYDDDEVKYMYMDGEKLTCQTPGDGLKRFADFLQKQCDKTGRAGCCLVFLHPEEAMFLMKEIFMSKNSNKMVKRFSSVLGLICLEDGIRANCVTNCNLNVRLSHEEAYKIVCCDKKLEDFSESDTKAESLYYIFKSLRGICASPDSTPFYSRALEVEIDFDKFSIAFKNIKDYKLLKKKLKAEMNDVDSISLRNGIFNIYPNIFCEDNYRKYADTKLCVAYRFIELLVFSQLSLEELEKIDQSQGEKNLVFDDLKLQVLNTLRHTEEDSDISMKILKLCINLTIDFVRLRKSNNLPCKQNFRTTKHSGVKHNDSSVYSPDHSPTPTTDNLFSKTNGNNNVSENCFEMHQEKVKEENFKQENEGTKLTQKIQAQGKDSYQEERYSSNEKSTNQSSIGTDVKLSSQETGLAGATHILLPKDQLRWQAFQETFPRTLRGLTKFCDDIKLDHDEWKDVHSQIILLALIKILEKSGISVQKVCKKLSDYPDSVDIMKDEWIRKYFSPKGETSKSERKRKANKLKKLNYSGIYSQLFFKFIDLVLACDEILNPAKNNATENKAKNYNPPEIGVWTRVSSNQESMRSFQTSPLDENSSERDRDKRELRLHISKGKIPQEVTNNLKDFSIAIYNIYIRNRSCNKDFEDIHEHIYFDRFMRQQAFNKYPIYILCNEFIRYIEPFLINDKSVILELKTLKESRDTDDKKMHVDGNDQDTEPVRPFSDKEIREFIVDRINIHSNKPPTSIRNVIPTLLRALTSYYSKKLHTMTFSSKVCDQSICIKRKTGLEELAIYMTRCFLEEARYMMEEPILLKNCVPPKLGTLLENIRFEDIDIAYVSSTVEQLIEYLLTVGFNTYFAILHYCNGSFHAELRRTIKSCKISIPSNFSIEIVVELCYIWIDSYVRQSEKPNCKMPASKFIRSLIKRRICSAFHEKKMLKSNHLVEALKVNFSLEQQNKPLLKNDKEIPSNLICLESMPNSMFLHPDITTNCPAEVGKLFIENCCDLFIETPGKVITCNDIKIEPLSKIAVTIRLCGVPHLTPASEMDVWANEALTTNYQCILLLSSFNLQNDYGLHATISNQSDQVVSIPMYTNIAFCKVKSAKSVLPDKPEIFCLRLLRHYWGVCRIKEVKINEEVIEFGNEFGISLPKSIKTSLKVTKKREICDTACFKLSSLICFLNNFDPESKAISAYENYMAIAIKENEDIVSKMDSISIYGFLSGHKSMCKNLVIGAIEPSTIKKKISLTDAGFKEFIENVHTEGTENSLEKENFEGLQTNLSEVLYENKRFYHINRERKHFSKTVGVIVHILMKKQTFFRLDTALVILENFLKVLHGVGSSISVLQFNGFRMGQLRSRYEILIMNHLVQYYKENRDMYNECKEKFGVEALNAIGEKNWMNSLGVVRNIEYQKRLLRSLLALVNLFSHSNVFGKQKFKNRNSFKSTLQNLIDSEESSWNDDNSVQLQDFLRHLTKTMPKKCKDLNIDVKVENEKLGDTTNSSISETSDLDSSKNILRVFAASSENILAYIIVITSEEIFKGCRYEASGSRLLNSIEKEMCESGKTSKAFSWAIEQNYELLFNSKHYQIILHSDSLSTNLMSKCDDPKSPYYVSKLEGLNFEFNSSTNDIGNPSLFLCSSRNCDDFFQETVEFKFSFNTHVRETLEICLNVLCRCLNNRVDCLRESEYGVCTTTSMKQNAVSIISTSINEDLAIRKRKRLHSNEGCEEQYSVKKAKTICQESTEVEIDPYAHSSIRSLTLDKDLKDVVKNAQSIWRISKKVDEFKPLKEELIYFFKKTISTEVAIMKTYEIIFAMIASDIRYRDIEKVLKDYRDISREKSGFDKFIQKKGLTKGLPFASEESNLVDIILKHFADKEESDESSERHEENDNTSDVENHKRYKDDTKSDKSCKNTVIRKDSVLCTIEHENNVISFDLPLTVEDGMADDGKSMNTKNMALDADENEM